MPDINKLAEKKLKSRVRKIKKVNKSDEEKEKFLHLKYPTAGYVKISFANSRDFRIVQHICDIF